MTTPLTPHRRLLQLAILLAFAVIGLGAWVRLSDAGLACPDWPACYGRWLASPAWPDAQRSGLEMLHRYLAGSLALVILILAWQARRLRPAVDPRLPGLLLLLVAGQVLLGQLTVSLQLKPIVVTTHLAVGMTTLILLLWQRLRLDLYQTRRRQIAPHPWMALAVLLVAGQIILGGWVSSHGAGLACAGFPRCNGAWWPAVDWAGALPWTASRDAPSPAALSAMHWLHRLGALAVLLVLGRLALLLLRRPGRRVLGISLGLAVASQFALGVLNVELLLPVPLAVAHNLGAASLLCLTVLAYFRLSRGPHAAPPATASASSRPAYS